MHRHGTKTALVDAVSGEAATYRDMVRESVRLARAMRVLLRHVEGDDKEAAGAAARKSENETVERDAGGGEASAGGDRVVGVFVENRRELVPALVASLLLGVPVAMLNPLSNTGELVRAWRSTRPSVSLCSRGTLPAVLEAARSLPSLRHVVVLPEAADDDEGPAEDAAAAAEVEHAAPTVIKYADLLKRVAESAMDMDVDVEDLIRSVAEVARPVRTAEHTAFLMQCGSGGRFARLTHRNLIYTVQLLQEPDAAGYGWTPADVLLLGAPLSHAFGLGVCLGALGLGLKVVVMPYFREQLFLSAVLFHKVSQLVLVPRQAVLLAHSPVLEDAAVADGLRRRRQVLGVVCAAAPLPRALHRDLTRRLSAPCRQAYGLTQSSCSLLVAPRGAPPDSQGRLVPGAEAKVVDVSGGPAAPLGALGPLQVGELLLRAPSVMAGYLHDAEQGPGAVDADGWLHTGDLAYYDRNGCVFVVDRLKDVTLYTRGHFKEFDADDGVPARAADGEE